MRKLKSNNGETLLEVLIAIIVLAFCFIILQTSIVASARMNKQSADGVKPFRIDQSDGKYVPIKIVRNGVSSDTKVFIYKTKDGYYYYGNN